MKSLEPRRAEWEKQILAAFGGGRTGVARRSVRSRRSRRNGAVLKIYNDEPVDYTSYEGGTLAGTRAPGNGLIDRERAESRQRDLYRHVAAGRGHVDSSSGWKLCRTKACRDCAWRAARTGW